MKFSMITQLLQLWHLQPSLLGMGNLPSRSFGDCRYYHEPNKPSVKGEILQ